MERERAHRRFTKAHPCPICGGHDTLGRGQGIRCFGYLDRSGKYARCTREELAGALVQNADATFSHRLYGTCRCGQKHGPSASAGKARPAAPGLLKRKAQQRFRSFFNLTVFLRKRYGEETTVRHWVYRDGAGHEAFRVLRVDYKAPDGSKAKSYRPCHQDTGGRWLLSRPDLPLPLYNLPAILTAPPDAVITLVEGEKCADIACSIGVKYATTSAHGAKAPFLTDWSPLAGRTVAILPDANDDGAGFAAKTADILARLDPPAKVRLVPLPGLSQGEDIEQWVASRHASGLRHEETLAELSGLIAPRR